MITHPSVWQKTDKGYFPVETALIILYCHKLPETTSGFNRLYAKSAVTVKAMSRAGKKDWIIAAGVVRETEKGLQT
jgi:hypothetical protein